MAVVGRGNAEYDVTNYGSGWKGKHTKWRNQLWQWSEEEVYNIL